MTQLPDQAIDRVANYFQALAEPTRLRILNLLRSAEHNVGTWRKPVAIPQQICHVIWLY